MSWGDYGAILFRGFLKVMDKKFNNLDTPELERIAPYIPDMYIANSRDLVIGDRVKNLFEEHRVTGIISYKEIKKKKIVRLDWENWDRASELPQYIPSSGEPEDYIIKGKHDEMLAETLPNFWNPQIMEQKVLKVMSEKKNRENFSYLRLCERPSVDIVCSLPRIIVSERLKNILEANKVDSVDLFPVEFLQDIE